jgi:hypothetical protein
MPRNSNRRSTKMNSGPSSRKCATPAGAWRMERVWQPDEQSPQSEIDLYEAALQQEGDRRINPRCLDDYVTIAYRLAGNPDAESET